MVLIDHDVDLEKCYLGAISAGSGLMGLLGDGIVSGDVQPFDLSQSVDITSSWDFGIRRRSNTGRRLFLPWFWVLNLVCWLECTLKQLSKGNWVKNIVTLIPHSSIYNLSIICKLNFLLFLSLPSLVLVSFVFICFFDPPPFISICLIISFCNFFSVKRCKHVLALRACTYSRITAVPIFSIATLLLVRSCLIIKVQ